MRLERTTSSLSLLLSCGLLALGACGDDGPTGSGSGSGTEGTDGTTGTPMTTAETVDTTAGPGPGTGTTTDDPTTGVDTTAGEEESTTGGTSEDSSSGDPPADCAGMSFATLTSVDNDMMTNLDVAGVVSCNMDIVLTVTGGTICVVDDGADGYFYTVETLALEDVPPMNCGLANVGLSNISIVNTGDGMEVVVPQAGGAMVGNQSIEVLGDVDGDALGMPIGPTPLMDFSGVLPEGDVELTAGDTTVTYADDMTVIATAMPEVSGFVLTVTLTGLNGSLTFAE